MPDSLNDIQDVLQQASSHRTKQVTLDGDVVEVTQPFPSSADWCDRIIYVIMIDRFNNPDRGPARLVFDDEGKVNPVNAFQGGKIKGITEKLGYLEELGVTALWITPPLQNVQKLNGDPNEGTYHDYGIQHFLQVDPRYGTDEELQELVEQAHARGIYVILDVVINHAGDVFSYQGHGSVAPFQDFSYDIRWRDKDGDLSFWTTMTRTDGFASRIRATQLDLMLRSQWALAAFCVCRGFQRSITALNRDDTASETVSSSFVKRFGAYLTPSIPSDERQRHSHYSSPQGGTSDGPLRILPFS